jgi:hypothetical protein
MVATRRFSLKKGKEKSSLDEFDSQTRPFLCDISIWEAALAGSERAIAFGLHAK